LSHVLRLHNLPDSIFHICNEVQLWAIWPVFLSVYKGKTKN
jgi:hypothetical protein